MPGGILLPLARAEAQGHRASLPVLQPSLSRRREPKNRGVGPTSVACQKFEDESYASPSSFPRKRESSGPSKSWIPARASCRQPGRYDGLIWLRVSNSRHELGDVG